MINVTHRSLDSEAWSVKYILLRLPHAIRITPSSRSALGGVAISGQANPDHPLNAQWVLGNPQCQIFTELQVETAACTLLAFLAEPPVQIGCPPPNDSANRRQGERRQNTLAAVKEFIDKSLALESLDAALIGRLFGMSRSSVYRMFEPEGGVANYIRRRRLMQAFSLLVLPSVRGRLSILDVAIECGFSSDMVFTRAFRKMFSLTPSRVRSMAELQGLELDDLLTALDKASWGSSQPGMLDLPRKS